MDIVVTADCLIDCEHTDAGEILTVSEDVGKRLILFKRALEFGTELADAWIEEFEAIQDARAASAKVDEKVKAKSKAKTKAKRKRKATAKRRGKVGAKAKAKADDDDGGDGDGGDGADDDENGED